MYSKQVTFALIALLGGLATAQLMVSGSITVQPANPNPNPAPAAGSSPSSSSSSAPAAPAPSGSSGASAGGGGSSLISKQEFDAALQGAGFPAAPDGTFEGLTQALGQSKIKDKRELAMFLAQTMHESMGYAATKEIKCQTDLEGCKKDYPATIGDSTKAYYGRGYMQLTWDYNYKEASTALFGDANVLLKDPDQVGTNLTLAWATSFWFWDAKVHDDAGVKSGCFGSSTKVINGGLECQGANGDRKAKREKNYAAVLKALGINESPNLTGCTDTCAAAGGGAAAGGSSAAAAPSSAAAPAATPTTK